MLLYRQFKTFVESVQNSSRSSERSMCTVKYCYNLLFIIVHEWLGERSLCVCFIIVFTEGEMNNKQKKLE